MNYFLNPPGGSRDLRNAVASENLVRGDGRVGL